MNWFYEYEEELRKVFQECSLTISQFPEPLNSEGLSYLHHFNVFEDGSHKNYICYLLPFWFQDGYDLDPRTSRAMSVGNVFLMLYFFIQDDVMDSHSTTDSLKSTSTKLPLANLFYIEFLNIYRSYFPGESMFWTCFNRYVSEWADSVSNEHTQNYFISQKFKVAHKASPLKLSSTAALLLTDHAAHVPESEEMLECVLVTLQMLDDYEDWEEDLEEGNYNCLLALLRQHYLPGNTADITPKDVNEFIYTHGGMTLYSQIALTHHNKLSDFSLHLPHLLSFHNVLARNLLDIAEAIETEKNSLQNGGLSYWLSKNT